MVEDRIVNIENEYDYVSSVFTKPGKTYYIESNFSEGHIGFDHHGICGFKIGRKGFRKTDKKGKRAILPYLGTNNFIDSFWGVGIIGQYIKARITGCAKTGFRDFSQSAFDIMASAAKEVEEEDWWNVSRWDCWYRMDKCFGGFIMDYQLLSGDVDTYYRKIIDMNDASVKDIEKILDAVYSLDRQYSEKIYSLSSEMSTLKKQLSDIADSVVPNKCV